MLSHASFLLQVTIENTKTLLHACLVCKKQLSAMIISHSECKAGETKSRTRKAREVSERIFSNDS